MREDLQILTGKGAVSKLRDLFTGQVRRSQNPGMEKKGKRSYETNYLADPDRPAARHRRPRGTPPPSRSNKTISREDPKFNCASAVLTVGRDGNVYLSSVVHDGGYILRVSRDGQRKLGGDAVYAMANATANAAGVVASANGHFNHSVNLYDRNFKQFAACNEFLVGDKVGWDAPARVEAGASGDFYGLDQHRLRILRISPAGQGGAGLRDPASSERSGLPRLRGRRSLLSPRPGRHATLRRIQRRRTLDAESAGRIHRGRSRYGRTVLAGTTLKRFAPAGQPRGTIDLPVTSVTAIGVFSDELIVKRAEPPSCFKSATWPPANRNGSYTPITNG